MSDLEYARFLPRELPFSQRRELADALLNCPSMSAAQLPAVIADLPQEIRTALPKSATLGDEVANLVRTCLAYPDGFFELLVVIESKERTSIAFQQLKSVVRKVALSGWSSRLCPEGE